MDDWINHIGALTGLAGVAATAIVAIYNAEIQKDLKKIEAEKDHSSLLLKRKLEVFEELLDTAGKYTLGDWYEREAMPDEADTEAVKAAARSQGKIMNHTKDVLHRAMLYASSKEEQTLLQEWEAACQDISEMLGKFTMEDIEPDERIRQDRTNTFKKCMNRLARLDPRSSLFKP